MERSGGFFVDVFLDSSEYFVYRLKQTTRSTRLHCAPLPMYFQVRGESQMVIWQNYMGELEREVGSPFGKVRVENSGEKHSRNFPYDKIWTLFLC